MLHVPFIGRRLGFGRRRIRAEADLHHPHPLAPECASAARSATEACSAVRARIGQDLLSEALDDADLVRPQRIEAAQHHQRASVHIARDATSRCRRSTDQPTKPTREIDPLRDVRMRSQARAAASAPSSRANASRGHVRRAPRAAAAANSSSRRTTRAGA